MGEEGEVVIWKCGKWEVSVALCWFPTLFLDTPPTIVEQLISTA